MPSFVDDSGSLCAAFEVAVPMRVSHAWVAFACQKAVLARPRWDAGRRVWKTRSAAADAESEVITVSATNDRRSVRICAEAPSEDDARRFVSALVTGMLQQRRS